MVHFTLAFTDKSPDHQGASVSSISPFSCPKTIGWLPMSCGNHSTLQATNKKDLLRRVLALKAQVNAVIRPLKQGEPVTS
jgi:hypothetical protein